MLSERRLPYSFRWISLYAVLAISTASSTTIALPTDGEEIIAAVKASLPADWSLEESIPDRIPFGHYWGYSYNGLRGRLFVFVGPADRYMNWRDREGNWHRSPAAKEALEIWVMPGSYAESWRRFLKPMRPTPATHIYSSAKGRVYGMEASLVFEDALRQIREQASSTHGFDRPISWLTWKDDIRERLELMERSGSAAR